MSTAPTPGEKDLWTRVTDLSHRIRINREGYGLSIGMDDVGIYLMITCFRKDTYTGKASEGQGGRRYLNPRMTDPQIIRVAFSALVAYDEHEDREAFEYDGKRIFGPHISIDALMDVADRTD